MKHELLTRHFLKLLDGCSDHGKLRVNFCLMDRCSGLIC